MSIIMGKFILGLIFTILSSSYQVELDRQKEIYLVYDEISSLYERSHPLINYNKTQILLPHHHNKRCDCQESHQAISDFLNGRWTTYSHGLNLLVISTCLGSDSLGNNLGTYFEALSCAKLAGFHFFAVAKVWEPKQFHKPSFFIDKLPFIIPCLPQPTYTLPKERLKQNCKCSQSCHENPNASWKNNIPQIKDIFSQALNYHMNSTNIKNTVVLESDTSTALQDTILPLVPDVAIHYRCGDNFIGHYGFLPFKILKDIIPVNSKTIYILAEQRNRKTIDKKHLAKKCDKILFELFKFLVFNFRNAEILLKRGDDLYIDLYRLTYAKTTICSVSTFCLWPAIANNHHAYFPRTPLILGGDVSISLGSKFHWIEEPHLVSGESSANIPLQQLITKLKQEK